MNRLPDLSGVWHGRYSYPVEHPGFPPTPFTAFLTDTGGGLTGRVCEEDAFEGQLWSTILGSASRDRVTFVKMYDEGSDTFDEVEYEGTISADGDEIEGAWRIRAAWTGRFLMIRQRGAVEEVERMMAEGL